MIDKPCTYQSMEDALICYFPLSISVINITDKLWSDVHISLEFILQNISQLMIEIVHTPHPIKECLYYNLFGNTLSIFNAFIDHFC